MKNILFILGFIGLCVLYGCDGDGGLFGGGSGCGNQLVAADEGFVSILLDKNTKKNLLGIQGSYNRDTVKIHDEDWKVVTAPDKGDGRIAIQPISRLDKDIDSTYSKDYYLYLSYSDTDTITVLYDLKPNNEENCDKPELKSIEVFYNGRLYLKSTSTNIYEFLK